ncbi:TPA: isoprenylcysteine carboxyl methyltransferase family protein [Neisseria gonorrhoeae]
MTMILSILSLFFIIRLLFLAVSIKHEKALIAKGAKQYGKTNSTVLAAVHTLYYLACFVWVWLSDTAFNGISLIGTLTVMASFVILSLIIKQLGGIWTVKIYILPNHQINRSWLFKTFRHPNYFLNIIPELIGIALLCQAWYVLLIGLPIYLLVLFKRIRQEEQAMATLF